MYKADVKEPLSLWEAARREMEEYSFVGDLRDQPQWDIPKKIVINAAVSGRFGIGEKTVFPTTVDGYINAASEVIEAGAAGVHIDFTWITDEKGRRLDRDIPPVEAYEMVLTPLRERFGKDFVANLNVLNGSTFEECVSPAREGLAEVAPCAAGHPDAFMIPAVEALEKTGVKPEIVIHSSGEVELAKRKLIDTGIIKKPSNWIILYGLPFNSGRTLISGTQVGNTEDMAAHLFLMVKQIRQIDPEAVIVVCAAGRATLYMTTLATMMGLHIRVGVEDTVWKYPNSDEVLEGNLQMFERAKLVAEMHGREAATAEDYRHLLKI